MTGKKRSRVVLIGLFFCVEFKFKVLDIEVFLIYIYIYMIGSVL